MRHILESFTRNRVFANIILLILFVIGIMSLKNMIRETFPNISLDMILIAVPYPGADPEEVEEGISRKIEEVLEGLEGVKLYTTNSSENVSNSVIEVKEGYDVSDVLDKVKSKVDAISTFPADAEQPVITELTIQDPVILFSLSGNMPEKRLKEWAERVKDDIQMELNISNIELFGARDYEISIEISEENLRKYGLTFDFVANAVRQSSLNLSGGTIRSEGEEIRVRTIGRKYTGEDFSSIILSAAPNGDIITLDKVAQIIDGFTEDPIQGEVDGSRAILLVVFKTKEEDAIKISDSIKAYIAKNQQILPEGAEMKIFFDTTTILHDRINLLVKNAIIGLCVVFFMLWAFLDARLSFWGGMGIPISITGALGIMWVLGATINMISLFALIMVLGIVVDDAIVVGESIYFHRKNGSSPIKAAVDGVLEVGMPVLAAVVTSIVAFLPLAFVGGIMGKFIKIVPLVVISCLVISLLECLFLMPAHLSDLPDFNGEKKKSKNGFLRRISAFHDRTSRGLEWFIEKVYMPFLSKALRWRYVSLCIAVSLMLITVGFVKSGTIKFLTFPDLDGSLLRATIEFPNGTPPDVTKKAVDQVTNALFDLEEKYKSNTGESIMRTKFSVVGQSLDEIPEYGSNYGGVQALLVDSEERNIHSKDLMVEWEKSIGKLVGIKSLTFSGMSAGPPGDPIEVWIQGQNMETIRTASNELMDRLKKFRGVNQVRSNFSPGKNEMRFQLKKEARSLGLTVSDLARQLNAAYFGEEAIRLQRGREDVRVKIRMTAKERNSVSDLYNVRIRTRTGREVPLHSVADVTFEPGYSTIVRTNGMRCVTVSAGLDTKIANADEIFSELSANFFPGLMKKYPGVSVSLQGEKKKMRESFHSLMIGFPLALIGIYIIIATIFRSYVQPFVIMLTVPFGIIGGIFGHFFFGYNLSMMSIFGMVALSGVVVNDAIVLTERVNENLAEGMRFFEAVIHGGVRRFRAIFLTTISTVGGLAPLILEKDMQAKFLIPMALSIAAGVAFATILTLVLIPTLLSILNDIRLLAFKIRYDVWPKREAVEPASQRKTGILDENKTPMAT